MRKTTNVGGRDRYLRAAIAVGLFLIARRADRNDRRFLAEMASLAASSFAFNTVTGYCGLNALLGVDTTGGDSPRSESLQSEAPEMGQAGLA